MLPFLFAMHTHNARNFTAEAKHNLKLLKDVGVNETVHRGNNKNIIKTSYQREGGINI